MDGLNPYRTARVAELLSDFRNLQLLIAAAPSEPPNMDDYYAEGWSALRQCHVDGQHILECAAETTVPVAAGGELEQHKAELQQIHLDAYSRRHEGQKIFLRQVAARQWVDRRDAIVQAGNHEYLQDSDQQLRLELTQITDEAIYMELQASDQTMGRWTAEDPSLSLVQRWVRTRRPA